MAKLRVTAFKKSGKFYTSEEYKLEKYPRFWTHNDNETVNGVRNKQLAFTIDLWNDIKSGLADEFSPVGSFNGFIFIFDLELEDSELGFLTYLLDRTE